jgi:hypothetical protein
VVAIKKIALAVLGIEHRMVPPVACHCTAKAAVAETFREHPVLH